MKHSSMTMSQLLGYSAIWGLCLLAGAPEARALNNLSMGLSLNYNRGNPAFVGAPVFGYGAAAGSFGALNGCFGPGGYLGGGFGGGGFGPALPPLPRLVPPHLMGGGHWGAGMPGMPYLPPTAGCALYCAPTYAYGAPQMMGPVQGGPLIGGGAAVSAGASGGLGSRNDRDRYAQQS